MKNLSIVFVMFLVFSSFVFANGQGETGSSEVITLKVATVFPAEHPITVAANEKFKKIIEEETSGAIKVDIYDNSTLGDEQRILEGVMMGTIEAGMIGIMQGDKFPKLRIMEAPYLFRSPIHAEQIFQNEEIMSEFTEGLDKDNVKYLGCGTQGFRVIINTKHPVQTPEDLGDIKLRIPTDSFFVEIFNSLGANSISLPMSEVFTGMEQGAIDGAENSLATIYTNGWYEAAEYISISNHICSPMLIEMNNTFFSKLSPEYQEIVKKAASETALYEMRLFDEKEKALLNILEAKGIQVNDVSVDQFTEKVAPVYANLYKENPELEALVEKVRSIQ